MNPKYPKKFSKTYVDKDGPDIIIRGSGELPNVKIVEYRLVKEIGTVFIYKAYIIIR